MERPEDFLKRVCNNDGTSVINYKYYLHSSVVDCIPFNTALEKLNADIEEMKECFRAFGIDEEKAIESTYNIWMKHLVVC